MKVPKALILLLLCLPSGCGVGDRDTPAGPTEILWDEWGIPHIYAANDEELFYAFGWAQARSHGNLMLRLYAQARGRAAEILGERSLESDRWVHTVGIPERAAAWWEQQESSSRRLLEAFTAGVNDSVSTHRAQLDPSLLPVAPVAPTDVLAHLQRVIHFTFLVNPGVFSSSPPGGSNGWAIAPQRSATGEPLLLINPHLPWGDRFTWFEAHLSMPGLNAYGATLVGHPVLGVGFNEHLGWTHTVNTLDGADLYQLTAAGDGYLFDDEQRPFTRRTVTLRFKSASGGPAAENLVIRESVHGPVVRQSPQGPVALRVAGLDRPHSLRQRWAMVRADSLVEFEAALSQLQLPLFTVLYADRAGHVLHLFGGTVPRRPAGELDWSALVPGDTSATLWDDYYGYSELPRILDPASGWLQNANDPPWTTTFPPAIDPADYPAGIAPSFMSFRAQRSARLMLANPDLTLEDLVAAKHSTRMETADRLLDDLLPLAARSDTDVVRRAARVLSSWDRRANSLSRGAVLFAAWFGRLAGESAAFAIPWSPDRPLETPDGLSSPETALEVLAAVAHRVEQSFGSLDVEWGEIYRLRLDDADLPASGGPGRLGVFRSINFTPDRDGRMRAAAGDSFVAAVRFSDPIEARALTVYGNSSQPGSPHRTDQLPLFAGQKLRKVWFTREDVEAHTVERKVF